MDLKERAARQIAEECGYPNRWREIVGSAGVQFRAFELAKSDLRQAVDAAVRGNIWLSRLARLFRK